VKVPADLSRPNAKPQTVSRQAGRQRSEKRKQRKIELLQ